MGKKQKMKTERFQTCLICKEIGTVETESRKDGVLDGAPFPPAVKKLKPVPGQALLECPLCHTYYEHTSTYNWYTTGGEDDTTVRRLTDQERHRNKGRVRSNNHRNKPQE